VTDDEIVAAVDAFEREQHAQGVDGFEPDRRHHRRLEPQVFFALEILIEIRGQAITGGGQPVVEVRK